MYVYGQTDSTTLSARVTLSGKLSCTGSLSGKLSIGGGKDVFNIATDDEINEMLNEVFAAKNQL